MRFVLACLFSFYLACPLPAQVEEVRDSATVMRILKEGKTFMQTEKTRLISAQYFGDAFRLADSIGFYKGQGEALRALGMLDVMDKYRYSPIAMDYFKKSLDIWEKNQDVYEVAHTFIALGDIFSDHWHYPKEALAYYKQALTLTKKMQSDSETTHLYLKIFKIYIALDDIKEATAYSKPLLAFYEKQGFHESIAQIKLDIAQYWAAQQEFEKAKKIAKEAQDDFRQSGGDPKQFEPYMNALKTNHTHTHTIDASRVSLMIFTVVVLLLIFGISYFYARRRVAKMT